MLLMQILALWLLAGFVVALLIFSGVKGDGDEPR